MPTVHAPTVSVAIPVYNGEPYLAETIDSVLAQSCDHFELIICDDHSTDRSVEIAVARSDSRLRLLRNEENLGFGGNWNRCLEACRGRYIKILPQDDILQRDCLAKQVEVLDGDAAQALALVFCARTIIGPGGKPFLRRGLSRHARRYTGADIARRTARSGTNPIGEPGAVLFRSSAAGAAGTFNGERPFVIDIDYWLRLLKFGAAAYLPEALCSFRVSGGSQSVRMARRQAAEFTAFLDHVTASGLYPISTADRARGAVAASLNGLGRSLVYKLAMKGAP